MKPFIWSAALCCPLAIIGTPKVLAQAKTGIEPLLGAEVSSRGIAFRVRTGGCTSKANFGLETVNDRPLTVRLVRIRPDYCEAYIPAGTNVAFSYAEIGAGPELTEKAQKTLVILNAKP